MTFSVMEVRRGPLLRILEASAADPGGQCCGSWKDGLPRCRPGGPVAALVPSGGAGPGPGMFQYLGGFPSKKAGRGLYFPSCAEKQKHLFCFQFATS